MAPAATGNIVVEAFRFQGGRIFVAKSEIIPGKYYWEGSTAVPKRKRVWIEIYVAVGNQIVLYKTINAKCVPAKPESWEFEENEKEN